MSSLLLNTHTRTALVIIIIIYPFKTQCAGSVIMSHTRADDRFARQFSLIELKVCITHSVSLVHASYMSLFEKLITKIQDSSKPALLFYMNCYQTN